MYPHHPIHFDELDIILIYLLLMLAIISGMWQDVNLLIEPVLLNCMLFICADTLKDHLRTQTIKNVFELTN